MVVPDHWGEVGDARHDPLVGYREPEERQHAMVGVVRVDPAEPRPVEVLLPEGRLAAVHRVEFCDQALDPGVLGVLQQVPVHAGVVPPLVVLGDLAAHEQQLPSGMGPHPRQQRPQVRELLPAVPGHLGQQRTLTVAG